MVNIFNKYENSSTLKYKKELTPNIQFQSDKIFVRNYLFEQVIKSCKATNAEFLILKKKLGLCPYEVICDEQEFILTQKIQNIDKNLIKKSDKKLIEQSDKLIEQLDKLTEQSDKELTEQSEEELIEIKSFERNENKTDWYGKHKFKKILVTLKFNKFNHKNKIGKLKFNDINDLINSIKKTIGEALAKQKLNALNETKK